MWQVLLTVNISFLFSSRDLKGYLKGDDLKNMPEVRMNILNRTKKKCSLNLLERRLSWYIFFIESRFSFEPLRKVMN